MPQEYIDWNVPEGGGGPNYSGMWSLFINLLIISETAPGLVNNQSYAWV